MSACPKGGQHVPAFPATQTNGWIIHYCKKCGTEMNRRPAKLAAAVLGVLLVVAGGVVMAFMTTAGAW
jgi:hypothetical protein